MPRPCAAKVHPEAIRPVVYLDVPGCLRETAADRLRHRLLHGPGASRPPGARIRRELAERRQLAVGHEGPHGELLPDGVGPVLEVDPDRAARREREYREGTGARAAER